MELEMIHIYCGDGKGKTTCATGLAIRMAGYNKQVVFARFLKNDCSGELSILQQIPQITMVTCERSFGFYWNMSEEEKEEAKKVYTAYFERITAAAMKTQADMLVLDEIIATCNHHLVALESCLYFLYNNKYTLEVVLTGREPAPELLEIADYVSDICKKKHPFDKGHAARIGVEY